MSEPNYTRMNGELELDCQISAVLYTVGFEMQ